MSRRPFLIGPHEWGFILILIEGRLALTYRKRGQGRFLIFLSREGTPGRGMIVLWPLCRRPWRH